jgi:uncharacterized protein DUF5658
MQHQVSVPIPERRCGVDRRKTPTTFWSALRLHGRRRGFRRTGKVYRAYVDCPSQRAAFLLFLVFGTSILDALLTLRFLQTGGTEANPFMALALGYGPAPFVGLKVALTGIGAWFLVIHEYFPMAFRGLQASAGGYLGLLLVHVIIMLS